MFETPPLPDLLEGVQSALDPTGAQAQWIATLTWVMAIGGGVIFLLVMGLAAFAIAAPPERRRWLADRRMILGGGIAFPVVTLSTLLVYGLGVAGGIVRATDAAPLTIEVVGEQWWWRVRYLDEAIDRPALVTANEIHIPTGRPVTFRLTTADVIHSFWIPKLGGKLDMIPGEATTFCLQADAPGLYRGQCAEYCGGAHALMAFVAVAHEPQDFERWMADQSRPAAEPAIPFLQRGRDLFLASGCGACHTIRGTPADGVLGPDLTHVGGRRSIGAGMFPNNRGTIAGWIADSQHLKPGNRMPSFNLFKGEELRAVAAYLESLK